VQALLAGGADPTAGAPLALAGDVFPDERAAALCTALIEAGAPVDQVTDGGWSALTHAVVGERAALVELLLDRGARADRPIRYDEHDASLPPGMTAAEIAEHWEIDEIRALLDGAGRGVPAPTPLTREHLTGRWEVADVELDSEGGFYVLDEEGRQEMGIPSGHLVLQPDGTLSGQAFFEVAGAWRLDDTGLVLVDHNHSDEPIEVRWLSGNRRLLLTYDNPEWGMAARVHLEKAVG
jgi:hypothetical protein